PLKGLLIVALAASLTRCPDTEPKTPATSSGPHPKRKGGYIGFPLKWRGDSCPRKVRSKFKGRGQECPRYTFHLIAQARLFRRRLRCHWLWFEQRQLLLRQPGFVFVVGADDSLHQVMADYVAFIKVHEGQAVYTFQNFGRFDQAAAAGGGQVDLRYVAGDHCLGTESQSGDEHLHLFRGRVLGFVEDDEGVVQGASAHEGYGRDLDDIFFEVTFDALGVEHVKERVVQGPEIGINLLLQGAGEKTQAFAGLDCRARQDDAVDLFVQQGRDGHGHGQVGLAGAGGADRKHHVVLLDGFEVAPL